MESGKLRSLSLRVRHGAAKRPIMNDFKYVIAADGTQKQPTSYGWMLASTAGR